VDCDYRRGREFEQPSLAHGHEMAAVRVSPHQVSNQQETLLVLGSIVAGVDELSRVAVGQPFGAVALSAARPTPSQLLSGLYKHQIQDHG
jgi:hypothetical protein